MSSQQIAIKTQAEIEIMREGGKILHECLQLTAAMVKPGISTYELDKFAEEFLKKHNVVPSFKGYHGFPATLCTSINEQVVHTIPTKTQILKPGDIISIDCGAVHKRMHTDATVLVGVKPLSNQVENLIKNSEDILDSALNFIRDGIYLNDLSEHIEKQIHRHGYNVVQELTGHGIGYKLHEPPHVLNYKEGTSQGPQLKAGTTLAIEPIFTTGNGRIRTLHDKWTIVTADGSLASQIEHTILITQDGYEILT